LANAATQFTAHVFLSSKRTIFYEGRRLDKTKHVKALQLLTELHGYRSI